jgi:hypothetical protein
MRNQRWLILICVLQPLCIILVAPDSSEGWRTLGQIVMLGIWGLGMAALMQLGHTTRKEHQ